jgi:hypothetical protein
MPPHDFRRFMMRDRRNAQHYRRAAVNWVRWTAQQWGAQHLWLGQ